MADTHDAGAGPDFAALYPVDDAVLTPRLAYVLCETAWYLADEWRVVADDAYVGRHLPPIARAGANPEWRERFAHSFAARRTDRVRLRRDVGARQLHRRGARPPHDPHRRLAAPHRRPFR